MHLCIFRNFPKPSGIEAVISRVSREYERKARPRSRFQRDGGWHNNIHTRRIEAMDLKEHFTGFYEAIPADSHITPVYISMYTALPLSCLLHESENPIQIDRNTLIGYSKMNARAKHKITP